MPQRRYDKADPSVSVVILNYDRRELIESCLSSVLSTDYSNFEVIFLDNNSPDGSAELVEEKFGDDARIRVIRNLSNIGCAAGNNMAAKHVKTKYVVFLNNDTKVDPDWLKELVTVMEADSTVGCAQSKLLSQDRKHIDSAGDYMFPWGSAFRRGEGEKDRGQYDRLDEIFSACSAAMITRLTIFREVGMFDPKFFTFLDDVDLGWRIRLAGYRILFVPSSVVCHARGATVDKKFASAMVFLSEKNRILMMIKNYDLKNLLKYLPITIALTLFGAMPCDYLRARIKALLWILLSLREILMERSKVQTFVRKVPDCEITKYMMLHSWSQAFQIRKKNRTNFSS